MRFIQDNWMGGTRMGQGSFDGIANSISQVFNFNKMRSGQKW
jgi:phospholipase C